MFKNAIRTSALIGILQGSAEADNQQNINFYFADENPTPPIGQIADASIRKDLSDSAQFFYDRMDREGKQLVYQLVNQDCKGQNQCKGLNSCEEPGLNTCAGKGSCQGMSKGPFEDKNLAVKVAVKKICERRIHLAREIPLN